MENLKLGYCCINVYLRKRNVFTSRTCRLKTLQEKGLEYSYELTEKNLNDLQVILQWNYDNNIQLFRMSSDMFPFATHPEFSENYDITKFHKIFDNLGYLIKKTQQRVTFHPSQFNLLSSENENVTEKSIIDIDFHAAVLDKMKVDKDGVIVIHGGSKAGGKEAALKRLETNFYKLSKSAQQRLVLENCEMAYSIEDLLPISEKLGVPIVVDYHHHNINPGSGNFTLQELTEKVLAVWKKRGLTPLFHLSESRPGVTIDDSITKRRAHSDFVENLPKNLLITLERHVIHLDIEAKQKEQAVLKLFKKYNLTKVNDKFIL